MLSVDDYDFSDVEVIPYKAGADPIAAIAYTPEYTKLMDLFRALLAKHEKSERALAVVTAIIEINPSHYSAWDYRLDIVREIGKEVFDYRKVGIVRDVEPTISDDGLWLNQMTIDHLKTYQVWNYRRHMETPGALQYYATEVQLTGMIFQQDPKNFHAWSHLRWVVERAKVTSESYFSLEKLLQITSALIDQDSYNNSCWSFRFFLYESWSQTLSDPIAFEHEIQFVKKILELEPRNASPWLYMRGLYVKFQQPLLPYLARYAYEMCKDHLDEIKYARAMEIAAEWLPKVEEDKVEGANRAAHLYSQLQVLEPVRKGFWQYHLTAMNEFAAQ